MSSLLLERKTITNVDDVDSIAASAKVSTNIKFITAVKSKSKN